MVQSYKSCLHVHTRTHILCAANHDAHAAFSYFLEEGLAVVVGLCCVNIDDFLSRYMIFSDKTVDDVVIGVVLLPLRWHTSIAEDKLRALLVVELLIDLSDVAAKFLYLTARIWR